MLLELRPGLARYETGAHLASLSIFLFRSARILSKTAGRVSGHIKEMTLLTGGSHAVCDRQIITDTKCAREAHRNSQVIFV